MHTRFRRALGRLASGVVFCLVGAPGALAQAPPAASSASPATTPAPAPAVSPAPNSNTAPPPLRLDFPQTLGLARTRNPAWLAIATGPRAAQGELLQAGMRPNPVVTLNGIVELPYLLEQIGLSVQQELELGGKRQARIQLAEARLQAAQQKALDSERQLRNEVRTAFAELLYAQQLLILRREAVRLAQESLELTQGRLKTGDVAGVDVMRLQTEVARRRSLVPEALGRQQSAAAALNRLVALPLGTEVQLDGELGKETLSFPLEQLQQFAAQRADVLAAEFDAQAGERDVRLQQAQGVSNLTASLGITKQRYFFESDAFRPRGVIDALDDKQYMVGLSLSMPLPINDTNEGNIQRAQAEAEGARLRALAQRQKAEAEVAQAYYEWRAAQESATILEQSAVERARRVAQINEQAYRFGARSLLDVLQTRQEYIDFQVQRLEALRTQQLALTRLEAAVGGQW